MICDLAEYYGIYDYHQHSGCFIATLVSGLRPDSRLYGELSNLTCTQHDFILANILDGINWLCWANTKDGKEGRNRPKRIAPILAGLSEAHECEGFDSPEAFEAARRKILSELN